MFIIWQKAIFVAVHRNRRVVLHHLQLTAEGKPMANPIVGFIGLGIMGKPMARNLLKAGYPLIVHNRSRAAVDELSKEGAQAADSAQKVAARSELLITMLPDSPDVELVYAGENGVFAGAKAGMV